MSKYFTIEVARAFFFVFLLMVTSPVGADDQCDAALPMDLGGSLRAYVDESLFVRLEVPAAGILSVDASVPGLALEPGLGLVSGACSASASIVLERSASHVVVAVDRAGVQVFRVASPDPRDPLGEVKISSAFVAAAYSWDIRTKNGENEEEIEVDGFWSPLAENGENEEEIEVDGFWSPSAENGENEEEIEVDGLWSPLAENGENEEEIEVDGLVSRLCRQGEIDDHGASFVCATRLVPGHVAVGEIGNGWNDDADTFHFVLDDALGEVPWGVVIEATADGGIVGALYDRSGQRLDLAGGDDGFRIVRTLGSGVYYVRVEGRHGVEGHYRLRVDSSR